MKNNILITEEATESLKKLRDSGFSDNEIGIVYGHYDKINNKWYCGETTSLNPVYRWGNGGSQYLKQDTKFAQAIKTVGWNNFDHYILYYCKKSLLYEVEKRFIKEKDSFINGYNSTAGYGSEVTLESGRKISEKLKGHKVSEKVLKNLEIYNSTVKDRPKLLGSENPMATGVRMLDFETKEVLKSFNTLREAADYAGLKMTGYISKCCKNQNYSTRCKGREKRVTWEFINGCKTAKPLSDEHKRKISETKQKSKIIVNNKEVIMMTLDGTEIKKFISSKEASIFLNGTTGIATHIAACCRGDRKTSGKYNGQPVAWRFADNGNKEREI